MLQRFNDHQNPSVLLGLDDLTKFTLADGSKHRFYTEPSVIGSRVILLNGAVLEGTLDYKKFSKDAPSCPNERPSSLRTWYRTFTSHALSCGYFVVPYEMLARGHGGHDGWDYDDIPKSKSVNYFSWMSDISRVLQRTGTFPISSHLAKRAASTANGYHAILALLTDTHPSFVDQPILLAMNWPWQKESQTIFEFYNEFIDTLRLRAIFPHGRN